jgi:hypothetical protein
MSPVASMTAQTDSPGISYNEAAVANTGNTPARSLSPSNYQYMPIKINPHSAGVTSAVNVNQIGVNVISNTKSVDVSTTAFLSSRPPQSTASQVRPSANTSSISTLPPTLPSISSIRKQPPSKGAELFPLTEVEHHLKQSHIWFNLVSRLTSLLTFL